MVQYWHIDQLNKIEWTGINSHMYGEIIFNMDTKNTKYSLIKKGIGKMQCPHAKEWSWTFTLYHI